MSTILKNATYLSLAIAKDLWLSLAWLTPSLTLLIDKTGTGVDNMLIADNYQ
ncbi:MAG: hypothetical protein ABL924_00425 [Methyloglobulus sp.]